MGRVVAAVVAVVLLPEAGFNLLHAVAAAGVELEQLPNHGSFRFVNDQHAAIFHISENSAVAQNHPGFDGLLMTEFDTAGKLLQFVLGNGGHNGQAKFRIFVQDVDVVVLEEYPNPIAEQLPGKLDGIQGVPGKPGNLFGQHQVEFVQDGIFDHPVGVLPLLGGDAGKNLLRCSRERCSSYGRAEADPGSR